LRAGRWHAAKLGTIRRADNARDHGGTLGAGQGKRLCQAMGFAFIGIIGIQHGDEMAAREGKRPVARGRRTGGNGADGSENQPGVGGQAVAVIRTVIGSDDHLNRRTFSMDEN